MIERFRTWLHRECRRQAGTAGALLEVGARLGELGRYCRELTAAVVDQPAHVTVLVMGYADDAGAGRGVPIIFATAARVGRRGAEPIKVEVYRPLVDCRVVVLADLERVDVRGIFRGTDVLTMTGPLAFFASILPGELVRVIVELREAGA